MRGMIKWQPFNTLLTKEDLIELEENRNKIIKPTLMEDKINEINEILKYALEHKKNIKIKYFKNGLLITTTGTIEKINTLEKYILINNTRIYFKNLINTNLL